MRSNVKSTSTIVVTEEMVPEFEVQVGKAEVDKERILAAVRAFLALASSVASMAGFAFDVDATYQLVLCALMFACMAFSYWKNNNWTLNSVKSQSIKNAMDESDRK